jgi:hypothetical protein
MHREVTEPGEGPIRETAARLGIQLVELYIDRADEFDQAFAAMRSGSAEALVIVPVPEFAGDQPRHWRGSPWRPGCRPFAGVAGLPNKAA